LKREELDYFKNSMVVKKDTYTTLFIESLHHKLVNSYKERKKLVGQMEANRCDFNYRQIW